MNFAIGLFGLILALSAQHIDNMWGSMILGLVGGLMCGLSFMGCFDK